MFDIIIFSNRVQELRKAKNISQLELANAIGVTKSTISRMESATRAGSIEVLCSIADFFNVSLDYLIGREDNQDKINSTSLSLVPAETELLSIFNYLSDFAKGMLIENARIMMEKQPKKAQ